MNNFEILGKIIPNYSKVETTYGASDFEIYELNYAKVNTVQNKLIIVKPVDLDETPINVGHVAVNLKKLFTRKPKGLHDSKLSESQLGRDIFVELSASKYEHLEGRRIRIGLPIKISCQACQGKGLARGKIFYNNCGKCNGKGVLSFCYERSIILPNNIATGQTSIYKYLGEVSLEKSNGDLIVHFTR